MDRSVLRMWNAYLTRLGLPVATPPPTSWHFCNNQEDADACARLVLSGRKRATSPSLWSFESQGLGLPAVGDLDIVTDWNGVAQCVIGTTAIQVVRFDEVTAEHAMAEGEGDGSLEFWRGVHRDYYRRELLGTRFIASDEMLVVCQYFDRVYP